MEVVGVERILEGGEGIDVIDDGELTFEVGTRRGEEDEEVGIEDIEVQADGRPMRDRQDYLQDIVEPDQGAGPDQRVAARRRDHAARLRIISIEINPGWRFSARSPRHAIRGDISRSPANCRDGIVASRKTFNVRAI